MTDQTDQKARPTGSVRLENTSPMNFQDMSILEAVEWLEKMTGQKMDYNREKFIISCNEEKDTSVVVVIALRMLDLECLEWKFQVRTKYLPDRFCYGESTKEVHAKIEDLLWATSITTRLDPIQGMIWNYEAYETYQREIREKFQKEHATYQQELLEKLQKESKSTPI